MNKKLYVGNLKWDITDEQLRGIFTEAGSVVDANIILDRETARSRGFGFVEMQDEEGAKKAIELLNGRNINGRGIVVKEAVPENKPNDASRIPMALAILISEYTGKSLVGDKYKFNMGEKQFVITREL